jgi:hypothetical protein
MSNEPLARGGKPPDQNRTRPLEDENPEALATFAATARNDGKRPKDHPDHATPETAAIPTDPKVKDDAAREVLRAGVDHDPKRAQPAVEKVPDRTRART